MLWRAAHGGEGSDESSGLARDNKETLAIVRLSIAVNPVIHLCPLDESYSFTSPLLQRAFVDTSFSRALRKLLAFPLGNVD